MKIERRWNNIESFKNRKHIDKNVGSLWKVMLGGIGVCVLLLLGAGGIFLADINMNSPILMIVGIIFALFMAAAIAIGTDLGINKLNYDKDEIENQLYNPILNVGEVIQINLSPEEIFNQFGEKVRNSDIDYYPILQIKEDMNINNIDLNKTSLINIEGVTWKSD